MKTDVHNHAVPESAMELLAEDSAYGVTVDSNHRLSGGPEGALTVDREFYDPAAHLANLEEHGLEAAVVSIDPPFFFYDADPEAGARMSRATNSGLKDFCSASPDRLHWNATVPMQDPALAATVLAEAKKAGCCGVEIGTHIVSRRLDEPEFEPFWAAAERLGLPVMIHPSYNQAHPGLAPYHLKNVIGNQLETTLTIERLICSGLLDRHKGVTVFIVHSGGFFPWQAGRLRHAQTVRGEFKDTARDPWSYVGQIQFDCLTHDRQALAYLLSRVGADNVLMGTDLPCDMATPRPWDDLCAVASKETAQKVAELNVARVFGV